MKKNKKVYAYYLLETGKTDIVDTWEECQAATKGKKARYKSFKDLEEATQWLINGAEYEKKQEVNEKLLEKLDRDAIYFDAGTGRGEGVEVRVTDFDGNSLLYQIMPQKKINEYGNYNVASTRTNNFGELTGLFIALKIAAKYGKSIICGDSMLVIDYWSKGRFNANNLEMDTIELIKKVSKLREEFERENGKIKKISGDVNPADLGFHR